MKQEDKSQTDKSPQQQQQSGRGRTHVPGQNPKANDDPSHDEHNDQNRRP